MEGMNSNLVGVIGAGAMGSGIAQACAMGGLDVTLVDVSEPALALARTAITKNVERLRTKEQLDDATAHAVLARIAFTVDYAPLATAGFVIEAATESLAVKQKILAAVEPLLHPEAIIASNTSSISITRLAASTSRRDKVIGMHFFNPVNAMRLVEIIRGMHTSDATAERTHAMAQRIGKEPIVVRNSPGFVVNRLLCPMINEAILVLGEGVASATEIDQAMKLGAGHPLGPLALCDLIGLDVQLAIMQILSAGFGDQKYRPAPLLVEMVEGGNLGRKTGSGFFEY
jgi:3-hydroxybutyryl-CoA dehydrogenase